jgi:YD repeat-containing protein
LTDYTYDAVGNRKTMVTGAGTTTYTYDAADRLTLVDPPGAGSTSYTFDDNGNLMSRGSDSFSWDAEDRLTSATVSSVTTTFAYNGDGLRDSLPLSHTDAGVARGGWMLRIFGNGSPAH